MPTLNPKIMIMQFFGSHWMSYKQLTTSVTAFSAVNLHKARVLLALAVFSPTWTMNFVLTVILTTGSCIS